MIESEMWIVPEAPVPTDVQMSQGRKATSGLRIGVLDNSKSNADHLLRMIVDGVKRELPVTSLKVFRKPSAAAGADAKLLDQLAQEADCVISAMAD